MEGVVLLGLAALVEVLPGVEPRHRQFMESRLVALAMTAAMMQFEAVKSKPWGEFFCWQSESWSFSLVHSMPWSFELGQQASHSMLWGAPGRGMSSWVRSAFSK